MWPLILVSKNRLIFELVTNELSSYPALCVHALRKSNGPKTCNLLNVKKENLPPVIEQFEDLSWLFFSSYSSRGIIAQDIDEAAYIFSVARKRNSLDNFLEIGRFLGGSTILIAVAKPKPSKFVSVDLKVKAPEYARDDLIYQFIQITKSENVDLVVENSTIYSPSDRIDFLFIDGDHSYDGVKADFNHYLPFLNKGADIIFHDAVSTRPFSTKHEDVFRYVTELKDVPCLVFEKDVGSIRHFKYTAS